MSLLWLLAAALPLAPWRVLLKRKMTNPFLLAIPAVLAWGFVHASGIHATVAGVLLGLLVPAARSRMTRTSTRLRSGSSTSFVPSPQALPFQSSRSSPQATVVGGGLGVLTGEVGQPVEGRLVPAGRVGPVVIVGV